MLLAVATSKGELKIVNAANGLDQSVEYVIPIPYFSLSQKELQKFEHRRKRIQIYSS